MLATKIVTFSLRLYQKKYNCATKSKNEITQWKWSCSKIYFCFSGPPIKYGLLFRLGNVIIADVPVLTISAHPPTFSQWPTNSNGFDVSSISASRRWSAIGDWTGSVDILRELFKFQFTRRARQTSNRRWMRVETESKLNIKQRKKKSNVWNLIRNHWNDKNSIRIERIVWTFIYGERIWKINPLKYWRQFINF